MQIRLHLNKREKICILNTHKNRATWRCHVSTSDSTETTFPIGPSTSHDLVICFLLFSRIWLLGIIAMSSLRAILILYSWFMVTVVTSIMFALFLRYLIMNSLRLHLPPSPIPDMMLELEYWTAQPTLQGQTSAEKFCWNHFCFILESLWIKVSAKCQKYNQAVLQK